MASIGIIGVGEIGRAIVTGLRYGGDTSRAVFLSPRGAATATALAGEHDAVRVCSDNQTVVDHAEIVIIAVRREDRHEALAGLSVPDDKIVVNVMAGVGNEDLRATPATGATLVRAIPLPAIRERGQRRRASPPTPPTTRPRTAATNASAPPGSPTPTPPRSARHSTTS